MKHLRVVTPGKPTRAGLSFSEALTWAQYYGPSARIFDDGVGRELSREQVGYGVFLLLAGCAPLEAAGLVRTAPHVQQVQP